MLKKILGRAARLPVSSQLVTTLEQLDTYQANLLRVITYHRIDVPEAHPSAYPGLISASPEMFEQQMQFLAKHYHVISMQDLLDAFERYRTLPPRTVLITFDDATLDFAEHAWPILQRYSLPATLFVPTGYPDQADRLFWWDRLYHALYSTRQPQVEAFGQVWPLAKEKERSNTFKQLRQRMKTIPFEQVSAQISRIEQELATSSPEHMVLGWDALRDLARQGVSLGAHTQTHPQLDQITLEQAKYEIQASIADLQRELGSVLPIFAYPGGAFTEQVAALLPQAGVRLGFTTRRGLNDMSFVNPLCFARINIGQSSTMPIFRAQLLPWFFQSTRRGHFGTVKRATNSR